MKLKLKKGWLDRLAKAGGTKFSDFQYTDAERFIDMDMERMTEKDLQIILDFAKNSNGEAGSRGIVMRINSYSRAKENPCGVRITRLAQLETALRAYIGSSPHKWIFWQRSDGQHLPYYVVKIFYTEPDDRHGSPASTQMQIAARRGGEKTETTLTWHADDLGRNVVELLALKGFRLETELLIEDHADEVEQFKKYAPMTGEQFTGHSFAFTSDRYRNDRGMVSMVRDGVSARLVMDELGSDDEDHPSKRQLLTSVVVSANYWVQKPKDGRSFRDDDETDEVAVVPLHPYLRMFDLEKHRFVSIHVNNIEPYKYDSALIDKLVLPQERKDLVSILIGGANNQMEDIIKGKTGGIIGIATGPAGTGKTLTAEVFAEEIKRPLYAVQCAQLGTTPAELETKLQTVLRRAERWNAILLLDEADVYIHARGSDVDQNAIVGVFLRVLEYYRGVLWMTSNRETIIDDAILSRATAWLRYEYPDNEHLRRIWTVLSTQYAVPMADDDIRKLLDSKKLVRLSGRSVKNLLKLSKLLSTRTGKPVTVEMIEYVSQFVALDHPEKSPKDD